MKPAIITYHDNDSISIVYPSDATKYVSFRIDQSNAPKCYIIDRSTNKQPDELDDKNEYFRIMECELEEVNLHNDSIKRQNDDIESSKKKMKTLYHKYTP